MGICKGIEGMVSVIMPAYNRGYIIARAIDSVLEQTFKNWELLVVDDCSNDGTEAVIEGYHDERIKYFKNDKRMGACYSRNVGMQNARGEYFCFLDSDCAWEKEFINERFSEIAKFNADLIFGRMKHIDGEITTTWPFDEEKDLNNIEYVSKTLVLRNLIDTNTVMINRKCWEEEGGFDLEFQRMQDWEYFSRIIHTEKYKVLFQDNVLVRNYPQKDSISMFNKWGIWRIRIFEKHIEFCRRRNILIEVASSLYLNKDDFRGNDEYRSQLCSLLYKGELYGLVVSLVERKDNIINNMEVVISNMDTIIKKTVLIQHVLVNWLFDEQKKRSVDKYLWSKDVKNIAIYGFGVLGRLLYECLKDSAINVVSIIDKNKDNIVNSCECRLISDLEAIEEKICVDAIVVTAIMDYEEIKENVETNMNVKKIFSLEMIVNNLKENL